MSKCDPKLGQLVHQHLIQCGVETPMIDSVVNGDNVLKIQKLTDLFAEVWSTLGMDLNDDSLAETPLRMAKMYVNEIYYGLNYDLFPKATTVMNKFRMDELVLERNISVQSNCEHHGVIIAGKAHVAYIPQEKVLGLSKLNRIVEFHSKKPQIQERLTLQIYHTLQFILETDDIAVVIEAEHYCVKSRGVRDEGSSTVTSKLGGKFRDPALRAEFMGFVPKVG